ncbi:MAG: DoxX family protein [Sphingobacteriales bacterium]|nr:MAG: DoxX family protein [Sphingobacteriales bacterium]
MKQLIFKTQENWGSTILRVMLGIVLFPHGAQKLLGWFGGFGFTVTMSYFTGTVGLPWIIAFLVIIIEFFGALMLIAGLATRLVSAAVLLLWLGILFTAHLDNGFFMNWFGNQKGEGMEYFLLAIGMSAALIVTGGGSYAADRKLSMSV